MENEQQVENTRAPRLGNLAEKLEAKVAEEVKNTPPQPSPQPATSERATSKRKLRSVARAEQRKVKSAAAISTAGDVATPPQATVKMDERMRMAWALMRATSGRTLQELQYEAFFEYLKKCKAFDMVQMHTGSTAAAAEG